MGRLRQFLSKRYRRRGLALGLIAGAYSAMAWGWPQFAEFISGYLPTQLAVDILSIPPWVAGAFVVCLFLAGWFLIRCVALEHALMPKFKISFDQKKDGVVEAIEKVLRDGNINPPHYEVVTEYHASYLRISISALSAAVVKECRAFIVALEWCAIENGAFINITLPQAISLKEELFEVLPNIPCRIDFMKAIEGDNGDRFCRTGYWPFALDDAFNEEGTYRFTFAVNGDGITADPIRVDVVWRGKWNTITAYQVPITK